MRKKVVSIGSVSRPEEREICAGCHKPLTKRRHVQERREVSYLICSRCYDFLQLSSEEKRRHLDEARAAVEQIECSNCGVVKTEDIRTIAVSNREARFYCTTCIDRANLSAEEKWALNQAEMKTKTE